MTERTNEAVLITKGIQNLPRTRENLQSTVQKKGQNKGEEDITVMRNGPLSKIP